MAIEFQYDLLCRLKGNVSLHRSGCAGGTLVRTTKVVRVPHGVSFPWTAGYSEQYAGPIHRIDGCFSIQAGISSDPDTVMTDHRTQHETRRWMPQQRPRRIPPISKRSTIGETVGDVSEAKVVDGACEQSDHCRHHCLLEPVMLAVVSPVMVIVVVQVG